MMEPWRGRRNAEIYDRFVREQPIYRRLNAWLVALAEIGTARLILDLACGTGATTEACLPAMGRDAEIVGVDGSEEMVEVARANVHDPRARFEVAAAASFAGVAPGPHDRVLCNAAFWQFPAAAPVLEAVAATLEPGGLLVFNAPAERVAGERAVVHPFQAALARVLEARTGAPFPASPASIDPAALDAALRDAGFEPATRFRRVYEGRQEELARLMSIPAMIGPLASGLSEEDRDEALAEARSRIDPDAPVTVPWIYFVSRKRSISGTHPEPATRNG